MAENELARGIANLNRLISATLTVGPVSMAKVGALVVSRVKQKLSQPGAGRTYRRRTILHTASAPGQPPAVDTGKYRASWTFQTGGQGAESHVDVGTADKRGPWLEFGASHMAARPHLRPVLAETRREVIDTTVDVIVAAQRAAIAAMKGTKA